MTKYDDQFQAFWKKFKGRWDADNGRYIKRGKYLAWQEWVNLDDDEKEHCVAVAGRVSGKYVPDACRWIKNKLFDDFEVRTK